MNISPISLSNNYYNKNNCFKKAKVNNEKKQNVSFKGIYVDGLTDLGQASMGTIPAKFLKSDALLLNRIAQEYPNQDCFIRKGYASNPRLEYREKPPEVTYFEPTLSKVYRIDIDPNNKDYPCEPLILYEGSKLNRFLGMPSFISTNPSLAFTVKAGFELHKKLMEKKYQIQNEIGNNDSFNLGDESIIQSAHKEIEEAETAVTRYLLECAYSALTDRASGQQIYASNFPKIQSRLDEERKLDLTTSKAKLPKMSQDDVMRNKVDFCEEVMKTYPNFDENKNRIKELEEYMANHGLVLN